MQQLAANLATRQSTDVLAKTVAEIVDHCTVARTDRAEAGFVQHAAHFYAQVQTLLAVNDLDSLVRRDVDFSLRPDSPFAASHERLAHLQHLIPKLNLYRMEKADDLYGRPFRAVTVATFHEARTVWRASAQRLRHPDPDIPQIESALLGRIADAWQAVIDREQNEELLNDLIELVHEVVGTHSGAARNAREAVERLAESEDLTTDALRNIFVRLVLFSEPEVAALLHRNWRSSKTILRWLDLTKGDGAAPTIQEGVDAACPPWIDPSWSTPEDLVALDEESLTRALAERKSLHWKAMPIPAIDAEHSARPLGFFAFGWRRDAEGVERFESARLMWTLLLQSLIFKRAALQQDALRGRIFSMVAHNLGSPLFQLCSDARILADHFLENNEQARFEKYDQVLRQSRHMQGIIDAILSIDGRDTKLALRELSLASIVYDVVRTVRPEARGWVEIDFPKPDDDTIRGTRFTTDEIRVYDILLNILANAVKYSPPEATVRVRVNVTARGAELVVRDQGPGIPEHEKRRVFEPFFRGQWAIDNRIPGLGLGLYVANLYAAALNGRIHIANESDQGVSFTVFLPPISQSGETSDAHSPHR
ncbi:MAG TPA: sensor histidine kinase [Thermoanaerobaculia bacterium]|nr:sensor histidine kinase [Thermoanaerobaculia bacterium]